MSPVGAKSECWLACSSSVEIRLGLTPWQYLDRLWCLLLVSSLYARNMLEVWPFDLLTF